MGDESTGRKLPRRVRASVSSAFDMSDAQHFTLEVGPDSDDCLVVQINGLNVVAIDPRNLTIGVWKGNPDKDEKRKYRTIGEVPLRSPGPEAQFGALSAGQRLVLLEQVFKAMEYDEEGRPGGTGAADTVQSLCEVFERFGVKFTPPE